VLNEPLLQPKNKKLKLKSENIFHRSWSTIHARQDHPTTGKSSAKTGKMKKSKLLFSPVLANGPRPARPSKCRRAIGQDR